MAIQNEVLGTTLAPVYTSSGNSAVTAIYLCNTSGSTASFSMFAVPSGDVADPATNMIYSTVQIAPSDTYVIDTEKLILEDSDSLVALASSVGSIIATVSFLRI